MSRYTNRTTADPEDPLDELLHILETAAPEEIAFKFHDALKVWKTLGITKFTTEKVIRLFKLTIDLLAAATDEVSLVPLTDLLSYAMVFVKFEDLQPIIHTDVIIRGLQSTSTSVQRLCLGFLKKAAASPSTVATIAQNEKLIKQIVTTHLTDPSPEIGGTECLDLLASLLSVDNPETLTIIISENGESGRANGQGLLWRRLFQDEDVYQLFFCYTAPRVGKNVDKPEIPATVSQARLLDLILFMARRCWSPLVDERSHTTKLSKLREATNVEYGKSLLHYVTVKMVDKDDALMLPVFLELLSLFITIQEPPVSGTIYSASTASSPPLDFLIANGVHKQCVDYYINSEDYSDELRFMGSVQTQYLRTYMENYPLHLTRDTVLLQSVLNKLQGNLHPSSDWTRGNEPFLDLGILASFPVTALVNLADDQLPLLHLTTAESYRAMATTFHGPASMDDTSGQGTNFSPRIRAAASRALFYRYLHTNKAFSLTIGFEMNYFGGNSSASDALELVNSILTSNWAMLPENKEDSRRVALPMEGALRRLCDGMTLFKTGVAYILNAPDLLKYVMKPLPPDTGAHGLQRERIKTVETLADLMKKDIGKDECSTEIWGSRQRKITDWLRSQNPESRAIPLRVATLNGN